MNDEYVLIDDTELTDEERLDLTAFLNTQTTFGGFKHRKRASDVGAVVGTLAKVFTPTKVMMIYVGGEVVKSAGEIAKSLIQDWLKKKLIEKPVEHTEEETQVLLYDNNGDPIVRIKKP